MFYKLNQSANHIQVSKQIYTVYLTPIKFRLPFIFAPRGANIKGSEFGTEIRGGAKIKGSELGTENRGERKLKGVNWSPNFPQK